MFSFDAAFHKNISPIPKDCPCRECDEPSFFINNPYYRSAKCEQCDKYRMWNEKRADNGVL